MTFGVANHDDGLESSTLTSTSLLLDRFDLHVKETVLAESGVGIVAWVAPVGQPEIYSMNVISWGQGLRRPHEGAWDMFNERDELG